MSLSKPWCCGPFSFSPLSVAIRRGHRGKFLPMPCIYPTIGDETWIYFEYILNDFPNFEFPRLRPSSTNMWKKNAYFWHFRAIERQFALQICWLGILFFHVFPMASHQLGETYHGHGLSLELKPQRFIRLPFTLQDPKTQIHLRRQLCYFWVFALFFCVECYFLFAQLVTSSDMEIPWFHPGQLHPGLRQSPCPRNRCGGGRTEVANYIPTYPNWYQPLASIHHELT